MAINIDAIIDQNSSIQFHFTRPVFGNCFFAMFYLLLRGKASKIIVVNSETPWWPHHYVVINKNGHALHFQHFYPYDSDQNNYAPWWFQGQYMGIKKSDQEQVLREMNRAIKYTIENNALATVIVFTVWFLLFVPWVLAWMSYTPFWCLRWFLHAAKRRFTFRMRKIFSLLLRRY